jgi:hypothetical protein
MEIEQTKTNYVTTTMIFGQPHPTGAVCIH